MKPTAGKVRASTIARMPDAPSLAQIMTMRAKLLAQTKEWKRRALCTGQLSRLYTQAKAEMRAANFIFDSQLFRHVGRFCYCGIDPVTNETLWIDEVRGAVLWIPFYETELEMEFDANTASVDPKFRYRKYLYRQLRGLTIS